MRISDWSSDVCSSDLSDSLFEIVAFRFFQGMFGAPLIPVSQTILLNNYPRERHGQAMGWWTMGLMFGPIAGPTLGGYITEFYNWRLVFYMNLPIGLLDFIAILFPVPESARESGRRSAERSVGKECVSPLRSRRSPSH